MSVTPRRPRRTIFFTRYEASQFGSQYIETEHLFLGLAREDKALFRFLSLKVDRESIEKEVSAHITVGRPLPTSVDLPVSEESKNVLKYAAEEADRLKDDHIGTEHLLLGLLREERSFAALLLKEHGAELSTLRARIEQLPKRPFEREKIRGALERVLRPDTVGIHGSRYIAEHIHDAVKRCRQHSWQWRKQPWTHRDIFVNRHTRSISFDLTLAEDTANFELVKAGWKTDHRAVCRWALPKRQRKCPQSR
jgi:ATP-dependent Clp protease ATP-binding subunit ClpA